MGEPFKVTAPKEAPHLTGALTLQTLATPDPAPEAAVRQRNGGVKVERRVVYDLWRVEQTSSN